MYFSKFLTFCFIYHVFCCVFYRHHPFRVRPISKSLICLFACLLACLSLTQFWSEFHLSQIQSKQPEEISRLFQSILEGSGTIQNVLELSRIVQNIPEEDRTSAQVELGKTSFQNVRKSLFKKGSSSPQVEKAPTAWGRTVNPCPVGAARTLS